MKATRHAPAPPRHLDRFEGLDALLAASAGLWRPAPYRQRRPAWCESHPQLVGWLLALDEAEVARLAEDDAALREALGAFLPELAGLAPLARLPVLDGAPEPALPAHFDWEIPGRKRAQVEAFAAAVGAVAAPVAEWCAGKGHLGRLVGARWGVDVASLERDPALCAQGSALARRARVRQRFIAADVLAPPPGAPLAGRHVLALHACGALHRRLVSGAAALGFAALDLSPCCYHLGAGATYAPLCGRGSLRLGRDELRLAVTGSVTASPRLRARSQRARAWKLGFLRLRAALAGIAESAPLRPVPERWLAEDFEAFCRRLAAREGMALAGTAGWAALEAAGERRRAEVDRLSLPRFAFRRALELWLVLDCALALEAAGFAVRVAEFCARGLTPRNLLVSARRPGAAAAA